MNPQFDKYNGKNKQGQVLACHESTTCHLGMMQCQQQHQQQWREVNKVELSLIYIVVLVEEGIE